MDHEEKQAFANRMQEAYQDEAPPPPENLEIPDVFWYLHYKAFVFLRVGADEYRRYDYFRQPPEHLPAKWLHAIIQGCKQILLYRGLAPDRPLEGIGVEGFDALLGLFHFALGQRASSVREDLDGVMDQMRMKHIVEDRELTLYNLVRSRNLDKPGSQPDSSLPCPYCGKLLRTVFAKQCRHCGMDWHDPANVINRKESSSL